MDDLISRSDAIKALKESLSMLSIMAEPIDDKIVESIAKLPSAQRKGHWVYDPHGMDWNLPAWVCSECYVKNDNIPAYIRNKDLIAKVTDPFRWAGSKFCPNCGAKMEPWREENGQI